MPLLWLCSCAKKLTWICARDSEADWDKSPPGFSRSLCMQHRSSVTGSVWETEAGVFSSVGVSGSAGSKLWELNHVLSRTSIGETHECQLVFVDIYSWSLPSVCIGTFYILLCDHPISSLLSGRQLKSRVQASASLQPCNRPHLCTVCLWPGFQKHIMPSAGRSCGVVGPLGCHRLRRGKQTGQTATGNNGGYESVFLKGTSCTPCEN